MKKTLGILAAISFVVLSGQVALADSPPAGQAVYDSKCASCHAKDGSGSTAMGKKLGLKDLRSAEVQKQTDAQLQELTAKGKGKMPAFEKKLTEAQIKDLVAYIRILAK